MGRGHRLKSDHSPSILAGTLSRPMTSAAPVPAAPPAVLSFAASDPTGGAGIQADILTVASLGCHPLSVLTAITVQDTTGVEGVLPIDSGWVADQARALLEDMPVAAFKIGLLGSVEVIAAIAEVVSDYPDIPLVLDPVLASGRGDQFADEEMIEAMIALLLPQTTLITPNSLEARRLAQQLGAFLRREEPLLVGVDGHGHGDTSEERERIYRDLHDDIGARLLTLMYKASNPEMEEYVRHTLQDLKTLTRGLAAPNHRLSHAAAEWKAGAARGVSDFVMVTLGTGIGSAIIHRGVLVPNSELGHLEIDGYDAEKRAAASIRTKEGLSWDEYVPRLQRYYETVEFLFSPDLLVVGGGVSKKADKFLPKLKLRTPIVPAELQNRAGIIGAAVLAVDESGH